MSRLVLLLVVALVFSSHPLRLHSEEPAVERLLDSKLLAEEGTGIERLKREKYNAALRELEARNVLYRGGKAELEQLISAAERLRQSDLDTSKKRLLAYFRFAQELEGNMDAKVQSGVCHPADLELVRYHRLELEIQLLEE